MDIVGGVAAGSLSAPMEALAVDTAGTAAAMLLWCIGTLLIGAVRRSDGARLNLDANHEWRMVARQHSETVHQLATPISRNLRSGPRALSKLGRNDSCRCGSGRKANIATVLSLTPLLE
jgi:hypothetical protein